MSNPHSAAGEPEERPALYYPYIHIRDENWLKGALLGFGQVRRIVPKGFALKDQAITRHYSEMSLASGPLLEAVEVDSPEIADTQKWLRLQISEHIQELQTHYGKDSEAMQQIDADSEFQMHSGKFIDPDFVAMLLEKKVAWYSRDPALQGSFDWLAMHPDFGSALMSVLAIAVARLKSLSVLTASSRHHCELLANREEDVFQKLLGIPHPPAGAPDAVTTEELSHVVITTGFDLTRLRAEDILELLKEGKDLRAFRTAVAQFAASIPKDAQGEERDRRIKEKAGAVLEEWSRYTTGLPKFAKDAVVGPGTDKGAEKLIEAAITGAVAGAVTGTVIGAIPGIIISVVAVVGVKMFRSKDAPLKFLSRIHKITDKRIGSIYVPHWGALSRQS
jgi:hypothetical protein